MDVDRVSDMDKEMGGKERKDGSILSQLTEQRMIDQMSILDKFYERYDSQQWGAVLEMELEVSCSDCCGNLYYPAVAQSTNDTAFRCIDALQHSRSPAKAIFSVVLLTCIIEILLDFPVRCAI